MAIYVKQNNDFEQSEPIVRECPHCGAQAPLVPTLASLALTRKTSATTTRPLYSQRYGRSVASAFQSLPRNRWVGAAL